MWRHREPETKEMNYDIRRKERRVIGNHVAPSSHPPSSALGLARPRALRVLYRRFDPSTTSAIHASARTRRQSLRLNTMACWSTLGTDITTSERPRRFHDLENAHPSPTRSQRLKDQWVWEILSVAVSTSCTCTDIAAYRMHQSIQVAPFLPELEIFRFSMMQAEALSAPCSFCGE